MARSEWKKSTELITQAASILEAENPMTIRQLFYRLVSAGRMQNTSAEYKKVSRMMTKARLDERVPFDWIVDRSRPEYSHSVWKDAAAYGRAISRSYRKDYWELQPCYVEVWCEKDAVIGSIEPTTDEYGLRVVVGRGFQSTTRMQELAQRLMGKKGKDVRIFYIGDHDPSGVSIQSDIENRLRDSMVRLGWSDGDVLPLITRLAIHAEDIEAFSLPALKVKDSDSRSDTFREQHGHECVELDALPPTELRQRIKNAVEDVLDIEKWNRAIAVEKVELSSIQDFVTGLRGLNRGQESV